MILRKSDAELVVPNQQYNFAEELKSVGCRPEIVDFIQQCLRLNPAERLTPEQALEHPFLKL